MIWITGIAGFVGSNIANGLKESGEIGVVGLDDFSFGDSRNIPRGVLFRNCGFELLQKGEFRESDILVHCATANIIYAITHPIETFKINAEMTIELFKKFPGKIIYTSTSSVYGQAHMLPIHENMPIDCSNAYDQSKRIAELYLQERGNFTTLRLSNVFGYHQRPENPYCGVIGRLMESKLSGKPFSIYGAGTATRDYTFIEDVVDAVLAAIEQEAKNTEINIGTGIETSVLGLCDALDNLGGRPIERKFSFERPIDIIKRRVLDISRAKKLLDWRPRYTLKYVI